MARPTTPGIIERHSRSCRSKNDGGACNCEPSYTAWVYDARSKRKLYKTFSGKGAKSAAKSWRSDATPAVRKGTMTVSSKQTVEAAGNEWIAKAKAGEILKPDGQRYKPIVLRQYKRDLERYVFPLIGATRLSSVQRRDVQRLADHLVGLGLSGSRVRGALMPVRAICRRAIRNDELMVNPTANLDLPAANGVRERVASASEAASLLEALDESDRPLWATAFYAGLRRGELRGLRVEDVDNEARVIHVRRGWDDFEGEIEPKSKKGARRVPMTSELRLLLLEHIARTGRRDDDLVFGRAETDPITRRRSVKPFTPSTIRKRALGAWAASAVGAFLRREPSALEPIGLHECRHTYVSLMVDAGFSLERIGDYVGHSSSYMTDRYRHLLEGHETEAADVFDAYLAKRTGTQTGTHPLPAPLKTASLSGK